MPTSQPKRELGESKFSMYFAHHVRSRTLLVTVLQQSTALTAAGIPAPLKSRPCVQLITDAGREFEYQQYDILVAALPGSLEE